MNPASASARASRAKVPGLHDTPITRAALEAAISAVCSSAPALGGSAGGIFLGFALAFLVDIMNASFYTEKEIIQRVKAPIVVAVPLVLSAREERVRSWKRTAEWFAGSALVVAMMAAEFYVYRRG